MVFFFYFINNEKYKNHYEVYTAMGCNCGRQKIRQVSNRPRKKTNKEREAERQRKLDMLKKMWEDSKKEE